MYKQHAYLKLSVGLYEAGMSLVSFVGGRVLRQVKKIPLSLLLLMVGAMDGGVVDVAKSDASSARELTFRSSAELSSSCWRKNTSCNRGCVHMCTKGWR